LTVALAESCISQQTARETPRLLGAEIDLSALPLPESPAAKRLDALLFGETQGRIIISTSSINAVKVVERARLLGIKALQIGTVGGDSLRIKAEAAMLSWPAAELHDLWWHVIARAMQE
jgi:phosphoribosylformylglycinamidine synthase